MESLLRGKHSDDEDLYDDGDGDDLEDSKEVDEIDDGVHAGLLESIGAKRRGAGKANTLKISEYQALGNDDRGELPTFRGIKSARQARKKKKKGKVEEEEDEEQDLFDEVEDDPTMTKPMLAKAKRSALYQNIKKDVSKWNSVVYHNRVADQLVFPLNSGEKVSKRSIKDSTNEFVPQTPLEEEMAKILYGEEYVERKKAELYSKDDVKKTTDEAYSLSVEEALDRHNEMARLRALQSYEMAKAKRRNKIKSKKYHRLLRREKIKKQMKEFEDLKLKDPEAAMEKLEELEVSRIKERMTLKHRNTSKWAKSQSARAKYDKDSRIALSEQLKLSKDLTQKNDMSSNESEDEESEEERPQKDGDAYQIKDLIINPSEVNVESSSVKTKKFESLNLLALRSLSTPETAPDVDHSLTSKPSNLIDPKNFLVINPKHSVVRDVTVHKELLEDDDEEEAMDDSEDQRMVIAEAFEDDDVVSEFHKRKADEIEAAKPKDIDLSLPGWGDWGGSGVKPRKHKKKRFLKKALPVPPRRDARLSHVIYNEAANAKIREHQVRQLPFPFKRVADFEKAIRAPVGRTWMPERAVKSLTAPKVITKLGAVIKPISEDMLVKKEPVRPGHVKQVVDGQVSVKK